MAMILYARFSPRPNASECDSCDKQLADMREYCAASQEAIRSEFRDDGVSGAILDRKGLSEAIRGLKRGDTLLVRDWDRLARKLFWQLEIARQVEKKGATLRSLHGGDWSCASDPAVKLLNNIMAAFAEYQRETTSIRTRRKMRKYVKEGRYMGGKAQFGFKLVDKCLVPDPEQQAVIAKIVELRSAGKNWVEIAEHTGLDRNLCRRVVQRKS